MSRESDPQPIAKPSPEAALIGLLTPRQRRTCALSWCDRLSRAQIATLHGVQPGSVKKRLQRARHRLRAAGITPPGDSRVRQRLYPAQLSTLFEV